MCRVVVLMKLNEKKNGGIASTRKVKKPWLLYLWTIYPPPTYAIPFFANRRLVKMRYPSSVRIYKRPFELSSYINSIQNACYVFILPMRIDDSTLDLNNTIGII